MMSPGDELFCIACGATYATAAKYLKAGDIIRIDDFVFPAGAVPISGDTMQCWTCSALVHPFPEYIRVGAGNTKSAKVYQYGQSITISAADLEWPGPIVYSSPVLPPEAVPLATVKCECGAEKAGTGGHSSWCPMYQTLGVAG